MQAISDKVLLQNLQDFTMAILRSPRGSAPNDFVGTGIAVSMTGIVTCAHVVQAAVGNEPREGVEVSVYFPRSQKVGRTRLTACFPQREDDVALLQLIDDPSPLVPDQIAILGTAERSCGHPILHNFRSYGYRRLDAYRAGLAIGKILGMVEPPAGRSVRADPVQLESTQINLGMSGAAVLDVKRNLVVGIVSEAWFPDASTKDRDTAWAVNASVLAFPPFNLPVHDDCLRLRKPPRGFSVKFAVRAEVAHNLGTALNNAPPPLMEWVGRDDLLKAINTDWGNPECRITSLIGFGGEGKSSLARRWLDTLLSDPLQPKPDGVFWWSFDNESTAQSFFRAVLTFMRGGWSPLEKSTAEMAQAIGALLGAKRFLFILDGLDVMQYQDGHQYGWLRDSDLRVLLGYFAAPGHRSFCLITSRAPILDLIAYTTYMHHDVDRLSPAQGCALLTKLGVKGPEAALDGVVAQWSGHALTLSLLGRFLVEQYGGDLVHIRDITIPPVNEPYDERVRRVLRWYDEHLTDAQRTFLMLFSVFRKPVGDAALKQVFRSGKSTNALNLSIAALRETALQDLLQDLLRRGILRYNPEGHQYTVHPLIREYYHSRLNERDIARVQAVHKSIKDYYVSLAEKASAPARVNEPKNEDSGLAGEAPHVPWFIPKSRLPKDHGVSVPDMIPKLDDLTRDPLAEAYLIEAVHHACCAGDYDEGFDIYWNRVLRLGSFALGYRVHGVSASSENSDLGVLLEFFPNADTSQDSQVTHFLAKYWILTECGLTLTALGRPRDAESCYKRLIAICPTNYRNEEAGLGYTRLAELYAYLGELRAGARAAAEALALAPRAWKVSYAGALSCYAWIAHLRGKVKQAAKAFKDAQDILKQWEIPDVSHATRCAEHLLRTRKAAEARRVVEKAKKLYRGFDFSEVSALSRLLGELDSHARRHDSARRMYDEAVSLSQSIFARRRRPVIIEALLARGRWAARRGQVRVARGDLEKTLSHAVEGGFRVYEVDALVGLALVHFAAGDVPAARESAERAQRMSSEIGYHWGRVDAAEILASARPKPFGVVSSCSLKDSCGSSCDRRETTP